MNAGYLLKSGLLRFAFACLALVLAAFFAAQHAQALRVPRLVNLDFGLFRDFIRIRRLYVCS